jgi:hypothetical protein
MPLLMASTPDRATAPDENARASRNAEALVASAPSPVNSRSDSLSTGSAEMWPSQYCTRPHTISVPRIRMYT